MFKNLKRVLEAAGSSLDKVVKVNIYLTDMSHFPKIVELRGRYFSRPWPADTIVGPEVTRAFARKMCGNGARLRYLAITGSGHDTSARDSAEATLDWIDARFAGASAPSDCGGI